MRRMRVSLRLAALVQRLFLDEGHTRAARDVVEEMGAAGYQPRERFDFLPTQWFQIFAPAAVARAG
ncbi:MAG: hypothetical protein JSU66_15420 [Deltaproteobacteria bacterium]|nr:MAG: hypothetical protein JSU66_15420 [Deltaproteobacteria bacterium]